VKDIMMAVTLFAAGRIGIISQQSLSMDTSHIVCQLLGVTGSAIDRFQIIGMGKSFICCIGMAG
jgi:hypothetical protein